MAYLIKAYGASAVTGEVWHCIELKMVGRLIQEVTQGYCEWGMEGEAEVVNKARPVKARGSACFKTVMSNFFLHGYTICLINRSYRYGALGIMSTDENARIIPIPINM